MKTDKDEGITMKTDKDGFIGILLITVVFGAIALFLISISGAIVYGLLYLLGVRDETVLMQISGAIGILIAMLIVVIIL